MPLWGTTHDSATNKPKYLPADEDSDFNKAECYATQSGWVMQAGTESSGNDNTSADVEVLVAIGGLAGADASTGLRAPTVTSIRFIKGTTATTDLTASNGAQTSEINVEITYDEAVTVVGTPTVVITNDNASGGGYGNYTLSYITAGSTANRLRFKVTSVDLGNSDVLRCGVGNNIVLAGGSTISDTVVGGTTLAASLDLSAVPVAITVLT